MPDTDRPPTSSSEQATRPTPPDDLSPAGTFIFRLLAEATEPLTSAELAARTGRHRRTVQAELTRLRERELVVRRPDLEQPSAYRYALQE